MTNGGTHYKGQILLANSGRTEEFPGNLALVNRDDPSNVTVLINQAFGKQFNAPNDVVVHPSGSIFFTDATYGELASIAILLSVSLTCGSLVFFRLHSRLQTSSRSPSDDLAIRAIQVR